MYIDYCLFFFFFSSRRRHTRYWRDWSSDVCSSDLGDTNPGGKVNGGEPVDPADQAAISQRGGFAPDAQTSGTAVREVGQGSEAEGKKKKRKSFGRRRR